MMTIEIDGHKVTLTTEQTEKGVGLTVTMTGGEYKDDGWTELYEDGDDGLARMLFESLAGASEAERYPTFEKWEEYMRYMGDFENIKEEGYNRSCATLKRWQKAANGLSADRVLDYLSDNYEM